MNVRTFDIATGWNRRLPLSEVRSLLLGHCIAVPERTRSPDTALGLVVARDVVSARPLPALPTALVDGWAVTAADLAGASSYAPLRFADGHPIAIGQGVPAGCDAVLPDTAVAFEAERPLAVIPLAPGDNLRRVGEDAPAGAVMLAAGRRLTPLGAALASAAGADSVAVRIPWIEVIANHAGMAARLMTGAIRGFGAAVRSTAGETMAESSPESPIHLTVVLGGAAIGPGDPALAGCLARADWRGIGRPAMRPGDSLVCGIAGGRPVIVVPSRLDSLLAALLLLVRPLIDCLAAADEPAWRETRPLARKIASPVGFADLVLLADAADGRSWMPIGAGEFDWTALASVRAFAEIPPDSEGAAKDQPFEAAMLTGPGSAGLWSA